MAKTKFIAAVFAVSIAALSINAQPVTITGTVIDSVTKQPQANAVVSIAETPTIRDTTDCYGAFTLGGAVGVKPVSYFVAGKAKIWVRNGNLTVLNALPYTAITVSVFTAAGKCVYYATKEFQPDIQTTFFGLWKAPGFYSVKIRLGQYEKTFTHSGIGEFTTSLSIESNQISSGFAKAMATYTIAVAKLGYASKQVVTQNGSGSMGAIEMKPVAPTLPVAPMAIISQGIPVFASSGQSSKNNANGTYTAGLWYSDVSTGWIAYDLSSKPAAQRQMILLAWYDPRAGYFYWSGSDGLPMNYTIEVNNAPGGTCPTTGWTAVLAVTGNGSGSRFHEVHMRGANWIRMNVTASSNAQVCFGMDIYDVSTGFTNAILHLGDSNTSMYLGRWGTNIPNAILALKPGVWMAWDGAGIGGTGSADALARIDSVLITFPGKFIAVNHGTNDNANNSNDTAQYFANMDTIVTKITNAGRIPFIPTVPWRGDLSDMTDSVTVRKNMVLARLYAKWPQIAHGPDLWTLSYQNSTLMGGLHWTGVGADSLRSKWIKLIASKIE